MKKYIILLFILVLSVQTFGQLDASNVTRITSYKPGLIFPVQTDSVDVENGDTLKVWKVLSWENLNRFDSLGAYIALDSLGVRIGNQDSLIYEIDTTIERNGQTLLTYGFMIEEHDVLLSVLDTAINSRVTEWDYYKDRQGTVDTIGMLQTDITQLSDQIDLRAFKTQLNGDTLMSHINISPSAVTISGNKVTLESNSDYMYQKSRITNTESSISTHTSQITSLSGAVTGLSSTVALKANVTKVDSLTGRVDAAESGIIANANNINGINSSLYLYAKEDSIISSINLSSEGADISADKINLYGVIKAFNGTSDSTVIDGGKIKANTITALGAVTAGSFNIGSGKFVVSPTGYLTATNATITGTIHATDGYFPGNLITGEINASTINVTNLNASNITTGFLDTTRIKDGTINFNKINANTINSLNLIADSIKANAIVTSPVITGGTFQTAATGQRVVIGNSNDIKFYDAVGTNTGSIKGLNGALYCYGDMYLSNTLHATNISMSGGLDIGSSAFTVNGEGNITNINGLSYSFPSFPGATNTYLKNDGSGNLSWSSVSGSGGGTVTSVACSSASTAALTVTGGTITSSGTFVFTVDADLVDLADGSLSGSKVGSGINANNITSGILSIGNGGTGAYDVSGAQSNLQLVPGINVQAYDADLSDLADGSLTGSKVGSGISAANITSGTLPRARLDGITTTFHFNDGLNNYTATVTNGLITAIILDE